MESDIILEGCKQSIVIHNIIYHKLIGDGDNSITKKLNCKNHLLRNYMNRITDIAGKRKCSSGIVVPGALRKLLKDNKLRLQYYTILYNYIFINF
jgi:hypothetical protein